MCTYFIITTMTVNGALEYEVPDKLLKGYEIGYCKDLSIDGD